MAGCSGAHARWILLRMFCFLLVLLSYPFCSFRQTAMINVVWSQIGATFLAKFDRFEALVADCYQNEKLSITREEVVAMFQQLLPAAAPGAVAGTGRSSASVSWAG